jgi:hypothetical protein
MTERIFNELEIVKKLLNFDLNQRLGIMESLNIRGNTETIRVDAYYGDVRYDVTYKNLRVNGKTAQIIILKPPSNVRLDTENIEINLSKLKLNPKAKEFNIFVDGSVGTLSIIHKIPKKKKKKSTNIKLNIKILAHISLLCMTIDR